MAFLGEGLHGISSWLEKKLVWIYNTIALKTERQLRSLLWLLGGLETNWLSDNSNYTMPCATLSSCFKFVAISDIFEVYLICMACIFEAISNLLWMRKKIICFRTLKL